jgi:hypothetical protein
MSQRARVIASGDRRTWSKEVAGMAVKKGAAKERPSTCEAADDSELYRAAV